MFRIGLNRLTKSSYMTIVSFMIVLAGLVTLCSSANAQPGQSSSGPQAGKTGKEACAFLETPVLDEQKFGTSNQDQQFNILRDLRSRMADVLPKQRAKEEASRVKADKLGAELKTLEDRFTDADRDTENLTRRSASLEQEISSAREQLARAQSDEDKDRARRELDSLQREKRLLDNFLQDRKGIGDRSTNLRRDLEREQLTAQQENSCYLYLQDLNSRIEQRTVELLLPATQRNTFKLILSAIYALIVFGLIIGFYILAYQDKDMRSTIFSQQSGIQFITLFSLVIAIILFGILEILHDKELAALLGGISGYILGRTTTDKPSSGSTTSTKHLAANTIGFTAPNQITDTAGGLTTFSTGDRIQVAGSTNNNGVFTISSVTPGAIQTRENTIQNEAPGTNVRVTTT